MARPPAGGGLLLLLAARRRLRARLLAKLAAHAARHPEASAVYCDMQHFGAADSLLVYPSVTGFALQRVLTQIERNGPAPIRCLVRADAMRAALPIVQVGQWAVTLAAAGELHRVPEALYRRRVRPDSLSIKMRSGGPAQARAGTLEWGVERFPCRVAGHPAAGRAEAAPVRRRSADEPPAAPELPLRHGGSGFGRDGFSFSRNSCMRCTTAAA